VRPLTILRSDKLEFPDVASANREGLLAVGGDLSTERLLLAYRSGIFPWTDEPLTWWSPDPRAIFDLHSFTPPTRLAQKIRRSPFTITFDRAFAQVIEACAQPARGRETSWISPNFVAAYARLHAEGHAHSVEAWQGEQLVGGVYGVCLGGFFAGESMFHLVTDASKIALVHLFTRLRDRGFLLFDTQVVSPLTVRLGAIEIPRNEYLRRLKVALACKTKWKD